MTARTDSYARTLTAQPDWTHAACKGMNQDLWIRPEGQDAWLPEVVEDESGNLVSRLQVERVRHEWDEEPGKQICRGCPISLQCLEWSLVAKEEYGIWGGFNEHERARMRGGGRWRDKDRCLQPRCGRVATHGRWCRGHEGMVA